ncbi:MAG: ATP synthase epsilon chain [Parcubacteria group bacterium GW2011_GWE2_39_37]|uniref:ATP synthase epsilon chain n=1 Tax=Candidatus Falkowbacteria bacterium GW2011_GWF2_39_8 TaxID=1618642 RepID=A0A0G0T4L1_9BACT|nr:MAG: ATP synthase epsilon chain [Parcubacteria group bacterium GW2011_GWE2_39_37]KKR32742.1 MAG: ATP synthase epsilon chain [Candidatus Falkowbacteria bacterium GW2011_GWF2_39_8]
MSEQKIKFKIVTPEKTVYENEVDSATLPVVNGQVTIMPNHRSYIASIKPGEIILRKGQEEIDLAISGGFIEFNNNILVVLADTAEIATEIDVERAEEARKRAEDLKKQKVTMGEIEYARVAAAIEKEMARLRVAKKHHTKRKMNID